MVCAAARFGRADAAAEIHHGPGAVMNRSPAGIHIIGEHARLCRRSTLNGPIGNHLAGCPAADLVDLLRAQRTRARGPTWLWKLGSASQAGGRSCHVVHPASAALPAPRNPRRFASGAGQAGQNPCRSPGRPAPSGRRTSSRTTPARSPHDFSLSVTVGSWHAYYSLSSAAAVVAAAGAVVESAWPSRRLAVRRQGCSPVR